MMAQLTLYNGPDRLALPPGTAARATPPSPIGWEGLGVRAAGEESKSPQLSYLATYRKPPDAKTRSLSEAPT